MGTRCPGTAAASRHGALRVARKRQALITAHAELQERELIKLASLAAAIADSLRRRGVRESAVRLIAELGIAIFKSAFVRWLEDRDQRDLSHPVRTALNELRTATALPNRSPSRSRVAKTSRRKT